MQADMFCVDAKRFARSCQAVLHEAQRDNGIGTMGEKSIHAVLKQYFAADPDTHEQAVGAGVADIVGENGVIEIQTKAFYRLNNKLNTLLPECPVTVVYPVIRRKRIHWVSPENGELLRSGTWRAFQKDESVFAELYQIRAHISHPHFQLCVVALEAEDYRLANGFGNEKRRRATKMDRIPTQLIELRMFEGPAAYASFVPATLPEIFTSAQYAKIQHVPKALAQHVLRVLCILEVIRICGKDGRQNLYERKIESK